MDLVYVRLERDHYKEDTTWKCQNSLEALALSRWLIYLGLNAQRIDQEVFDAMPNKIEIDF